MEEEDALKLFSDLRIISQQLPGIILWKKDINSVFVDANENCYGNLFGLHKVKDVIGLADYELPCKLCEFAETFQEQDKKVMLIGKPLKTLEIHPCVRDEWKILLSVKNVFMKKNNIIGTIGYAVDLTDIFFEIGYLLSQSVANKFKKINSKLLQSSYIIGQDYVNFKLSQRQSECIFFLVRGKTIKEIAKFLNLSPRTVEDHVENLKLKFSCRTKNELIDTVIAQGFMNIIPKGLLNSRISIILRSS